MRIDIKHPLALIEFNYEGMLHVIWCWIALQDHLLHLQRRITGPQRHQPIQLGIILQVDNLDNTGDLYPQCYLWKIVLDQDHTGRFKGYFGVNSQ